MTDLKSQVYRIIERDGAIKKDLARRLINIRALARFIQSELREDASIDAIISAVRRYPIQRAEESPRLSQFFKRLTMRNQIADVALVNDPQTRAFIHKVAAQMDYSRAETFRIVAGVESIRVIIDEKNLDKLRQLSEDKIIKVAEGLTEIIVSLPPEAERTPGVVALVTSELALNGINLIEIMSCVPELILVVEEKDALRSYELIHQLSKQSS